MSIAGEGGRGGGRGRGRGRRRGGRERPGRGEGAWAVGFRIVCR